MAQASRFYRARNPWFYWHATLGLFLLLLGFAHIASSTRITVLRLEPGAEARLNVVSLFGHDIFVDMEFRRALTRGGDDAQRSRDLGGLRQRPDANGNAALVLLPGLPVTVEASLDDAAPLRLAAMPAGHASRQIIVRALRSEGRQLAGGAFDEPDEASKLAAHPGLNRLHFRVLAVGEGLRGEEVELVALPPIQARGIQPGYEYLPLIFWLLPFAVVGFILWGMALYLFGQERSARR